MIVKVRLIELRPVVPALGKLGMVEAWPVAIADRAAPHQC